MITIKDTPENRKVVSKLNAYSAFRRRQSMPEPKPLADVSYYGGGIFGIIAESERERRDAEFTSAEVIE